MRNERLIVMMEISVCVALSLALSYLKVFTMPNGGSVSLQMVPLLILAFRQGGKAGLVAGLIFGLIRAILSPHVVHPVQGFLDYVLAFTLVGVAGFFKPTLEQGKLLPTLGMLLASALRFTMHVTAGKVFFAEYAPEGVNPWIYSISYNATHLVPETILVIVACLFLLTRRDLIDPKRAMGKMG